MAPAAHGGGASTATVASNASNAERKRVKVYELKNNDWFDRGTGFCTGRLLATPTSSQETPDAQILVTSEDDPSRILLETRISKDDGYQKQQDTLIVWTEANGVDMALSFQEAEACASIWEFVSEIQGKLATLAPDDGLSDDLMDVHPIVLPDPQLGKLEEVENAIRNASTSPAARDALAKFVMHPEQNYILKLAPLVAKAEELESTIDLHRLCTIMKHLILLNDTAIIEFVVMDQAIMGVVGALEYDPDFPSHRANHRQWLSDSSKFKEVVPIHDAEIRRKIHWTYRLLYLKDVVLARILDDPTFSVLNSLIFFHQVDIVNHLQSNQQFLKELFDIFSASDQEKAEKKKEAVLFIQNCCAVSKNIQAQSRAQLYHNFIQQGLFTIITFALRHHDASVRVAGTDILVALIDHDPHMVRNHIFMALNEKTTPLTDTLIELLLVEIDLGVKSQMADAIKILLDPTTNQPPELAMARGAGNANADIMAKRGPMGAAGAQAQYANHPNPQTNAFIDNFYESSAKRLFAPLKALEQRETMSDLSVQETSLYTHLVDVLCFFVRQHSFKSKLFILSEGLHSRVAQLLSCPQKYMKLTALKWFRTCIGLQDEFHNRQMIQNSLFDPILRIVEETMPRDNLLNSACLELFEYIKREGVKQLIVHLVEMYRERLMRISYVNTFQALVLKFEQLTSGYPMVNGDQDSFTTQEGTPQRMVNGRQSFAGLKEMDGDEEAYFEGGEDDIDDESLPTGVIKHALVNGASPVRPLVNYPDEDEEEGIDILASSPDPPLRDQKSSSSSDDQRTLTDPSDGPIAEPMDEDTTSPTGTIEDENSRGRNRTPVSIEGSPGRQGQSPPESVLTKRRREEDDDDELGKMMGGIKRRSSTASLRSNASSHHSQVDGASTMNLRSHQSADEGGGGNENGGPVVPLQQQQQPHGHGHGNSHILRRKGSLKVKNEASAGSHKFTIKPISLSANKGQAAHPPSEEDSSQEPEKVESTESDGGGDGG